MDHYSIIIVCLILLSTKLFGLAAGKLHLPQIVGALLAGVILGPVCLDLVSQHESTTIFLDNLAGIAVVVIMFCAGLETNIAELKKAGKVSFLVALLGVLVPLVMGAGLAYLFNPGADNLYENIFIGVILTATSVSITVETLKEMGKLSTKVGNTILAAALIDDVLGLICLTLVSSLASDSTGGSEIVFVLLKILLFFIFAIVFGLLFYKFFEWYTQKFKTKNLHRYPLLALVVCLFMAWAAEALFGVADIIGAFAAGLIFASTSKNVYITHKITPLTYLLLTPIFFANIGLGFVLPNMDSSLIIFAVLLIIVGMLSKVVGCGLAAKVCKFSMKQSLQIGIGMACRGEVALIVANKGMALGIVSDTFFGPVIIMVILVSVATPILLKVAFKGDDAYADLHESSLSESFQVTGQLDIVADQMFTHEKERMKQHKTNSNT